MRVLHVSVTVEELADFPHLEVDIPDSGFDLDVALDTLVATLAR